MGQWFLQWGWSLASLLVAVALAMMAYRHAQSLIVKSGGDWKKAILYVFGPFVAFCIMIVLMAATFPWAISTIYGSVQSSAVSQSFYQLGAAGVSALSGSFGNVQVSIPEAPSLGDVLTSNIPTEADLRNALGVGSNGQQSESAPAPAANTSWTAPASAPQAPANSVWANPVKLQQDWGKQPVIGPQPQPTQGPALAPTTVPAPTQGPAEKPQGWNVTFGGGGPQAADADAAIAGIGAQTYTVKRGDSLSSISVQVYGNRSGWATDLQRQPQRDR
jgi:hypothetical protein